MRRRGLTLIELLVVISRGLTPADAPRSPADDAIAKERRRAGGPHRFRWGCRLG